MIIALVFYLLAEPFTFNISLFRYCCIYELLILPNIFLNLAWISDE